MSVAGLTRIWHELPSFTVSFYPKFYDIKLSHMVLNETSTSNYIVSIFYNSVSKFYDVFKNKNIFTDLKMCLEFIWFQIVFCLFNIYYFKILFEQRQFPNPLHLTPLLQK